MNQETTYGTNDLNCWINVLTPGDLDSSTLGTEEEIKDQKNDKHLSIHNTDLRLDKYLFYISSRL